MSGAAPITGATELLSELWAPVVLTCNFLNSQFYFGKLTFNISLNRMSHARILAASNLADNHQSEEGILSFIFSINMQFHVFFWSDGATVTPAPAAGRDPEPRVV